ncbi:MAG: glycoside hydrolase family 16 protein [Bacteroidaceae bacterium]|nr:glycoside hydrolase family 16 protein [Bacteroidaceae bacterium]
MKHLYLILTMMTLLVTSTFAQISTEGYKLVYSSETPGTAASKLTLSEDELAHCTGDFSSLENMERNWEYCNKASSDWNKRMGSTDEERALVHKTESGHLRLLAKTTDGTANGFITGGVRMRTGYKYGIFEIKAKCNPHASNFPAIWMMPVVNDGWPLCGEIDIMEMVGNSSTAHSTVHVAARYPNAANGHSVGKSYSWTNNINTSAGYHIYSLYWDKLSLIFYCDGIQVFRYNKDTSLDLDANPDYEKFQFPYNKEFELILNQSLGKNSGWGSENPDPSFTYEMDVEYVRIWQAPETYDIDKYYLLRNYSDNTRYMTVSEDNTLTTAEVTSPSQLTTDMAFGVAPADVHGKCYLVSLSGLPIASMPDINKAVPLATEPCYFYMLKDEAKGVCFDYAKDTAPITYGDGSRALTLNTKKNNIVSISGNSKDAAWWIMEDATDLITGIQAPATSYAANGAVRKFIYGGRLLIQRGDKTYTIDGRLTNP